MPTTKTRTRDRVESDWSQRLFMVAWPSRYPIEVGQVFEGLWLCLADDEGEALDANSIYAKPVRNATARFVSDPSPGLNIIGKVVGAYTRTSKFQIVVQMRAESLRAEEMIRGLLRLHGIDEVWEVS